MLGKEGTLTGSTTGLLTGLLEIVSTADRTVDYIEDELPLRDTTGVIGGEAGDEHCGSMTIRMKFNEALKANRTALITAQTNARKDGTTETWTAAAPNGSAEAISGFPSVIGGLIARRDGNMTYDVTIQATTTGTFTP